MNVPASTGSTVSMMNVSSWGGGGHIAFLLSLILIKAAHVAILISEAIRIVITTV